MGLARNNIGAEPAGRVSRAAMLLGYREKPSFFAVGREPISKSSEEDNEAGELDKAEEVLSVVLPANEDATLPLYPGEEPLDEPAWHVTA